MRQAGGQSYEVQLFANGTNTYGTLHVQGFVTLRTANELGEKFAKAMEDHWPDTKVEFSVKMDHKFLEESNG